MEDTPEPFELITGGDFKFTAKRHGECRSKTKPYCKRAEAIK